MPASARREVLGRKLPEARSAHTGDLFGERGELMQQLCRDACGGCGLQNRIEGLAAGRERKARLAVNSGAQIRKAHASRAPQVRRRREKRPCDPEAVHLAHGCSGIETLEPTTGRPRKMSVCIDDRQRLCCGSAAPQRREPRETEARE